MNFSEWQPKDNRDREILCVGRCVEEKGILEAAQGVARVLPAHPEWRARFILSTVEIEPDYVASVKATLAPLGERAIIETQQPFARVKAANESAAIAIVPSKWAEPFGRTALEAHAGGAALISSGTGGLREASGEYAVYLPTVTSDAIVAALEGLITARERTAAIAKQGGEEARRRFSLQIQARNLDNFLLGLPK